MIGLWIAHAARRLRNNFYLYLAALFTLFVLFDAVVLHVGENMRQKAFDFMVRSRVIVPKPDQDIVIVDVNEASLAAMAKEYGRYPWPRQVFSASFWRILRRKSPRPSSSIFYSATPISPIQTAMPILTIP
jgi:CHASE2 domain-containing sensor protein